MKTQHILSATLLVMILGCTSQLSAQDSLRVDIEKCIRLEGGLLAGTRLGVGAAEFQAGGNLHYSYCIKTGKRFGVGIGGGLQFLDDKGYIPFYLDFVNMLNPKKNAPFIDMQLGYAFSWLTNNEDQMEYSNHGPCISLGLGKKFGKSENFSPYLSLAYKHQILLDGSGKSIFQNQDRYNYGMLVVGLGVMLEQ